MWFSLFDFEKTKEQFLSKSKYYDIGINSECFSTLKFWQWVTYGMYQALFLTIVCYAAYDYSIKEDGKGSGGLYPSGAVVYGGCIVVANFKILYSSSIHHGWSIFLIFGSILTYFFWFWFENLFSYFSVMQGIFGNTMDSPITYLGLFLGAMMIFTFESGID